MNRSLTFSTVNGEQMSTVKVTICRGTLHCSGHYGSLVYSQSTIDHGKREGESERHIGNKDTQRDVEKGYSEDEKRREVRFKVKASHNSRGKKDA